MNQYKKVDDAETAPHLLQKAGGNNKKHLKFFSFLGYFLIISPVKKMLHSYRILHRPSI
jgi:hypothetical protein